MYCACGCGKITPIAKQTNTKKGWVKGQHTKCVYGHSPIKCVAHYQGGREWKAENTNKHLCKCGCGGYIIIKHHHRSQGIPQFILGHHAKTDKMKKQIAEFNSTYRTGENSARWKKDRSMVRGRNRAKYEFTKNQKRAIYYRDKGICQSCGAFCLLTAKIDDPCKANIDHIIECQHKGTNDINNGQVLCLICHKFKHSVKANRMNSGKPHEGNPEPSLQSRKVQRLLESSDTLNYQLERPTRKG